MIFGYDKSVIQPLLDKKFPMVIFRDGQKYNKNFKEQKHIEKYFKEFNPPKVINKVNASFHCKLYMIKFENFLRVVVSSANLFENDWKDWNNILYLRDFERNTDESD